MERVSDEWLSSKIKEFSEWIEENQGTRNVQLAYSVMFVKRHLSVLTELQELRREKYGQSE